MQLQNNFNFNAYFITAIIKRSKGYSFNFKKEVPDKLIIDENGKAIEFLTESAIDIDASADHISIEEDNSFNFRKAHRILDYSGLSNLEKSVIELKYFKELSYEQISEHLKIDLNNVRTSAFRAINKMRYYAMLKGFLKADYKVYDNGLMGFYVKQIRESTHSIEGFTCEPFVHSDFLQVKIKGKVKPIGYTVHREIFGNVQPNGTRPIIKRKFFIKIADNKTVSLMQYEWEKVNGNIPIGFRLTYKDNCQNEESPKRVNIKNMHLIQDEYSRRKLNKNEVLVT
jgi:RNA polymerase sigma factor (sigma-70 family)